MARSGAQKFFLAWLAVTPLLAGLVWIGGIFVGHESQNLRGLIGFAVLPVLGLILLRVGNAVAAGIARKKRGKPSWRRDGQHQAPRD